MKNPFAKADGTPIEGKEFEFLDWEIEKDKNRINKLPDDLKKEAKARANHLRKKMES